MLVTIVLTVLHKHGVPSGINANASMPMDELLLTVRHYYVGPKCNHWLTFVAQKKILTIPYTIARIIIIIYCGFKKYMHLLVIRPRSKCSCYYINQKNSVVRGLF